MKRFVRDWMLWMCLCCLGAQTALSQTQFVQNDPFGFENQLLSGFSEDGRVKVLILRLAPSGMTVTASEQIGKALSLNLSNTNHFSVVVPSEWDAQLRTQDPYLADCHDIACGIHISKLFNADKVLVGRISAEIILNDDGLEEPGFVLSVRLLDVITNTTDYADEVEFTDDNMQDELFQLAVRISENTLLSGHVLKTEERTVTVDMGRAHGIKVGDRIVIYRSLSTLPNLEGQTLGLELKNIAIGQMLRVNEMSSDAIVLHQLETPSKGDWVKTYINRYKQINLIADTRRELDTQQRIKPRTRPLLIQPEEVVDEDRRRWERLLAAAEKDQKRWQLYAIGFGVGTLVSLSGQIELLGKELNQVIPLALGGGFVYSGYKFLQARDEVRQLEGEGRVKGYYSFQLTPTPHEKGFKLALNYRF